MTGIVLRVKAIAIAAGTGALCGVLGVVLALVASRRAARAVRECNDLIQGAIGSRGTVDPRALRDVAIVRYDALNEGAGQLSFSLALLNSVGDGVVVSSINGRTETRTYAKAVIAGHGALELSPEETQAVRTARLGTGLLAPTPAPKGRGNSAAKSTAATALCGYALCLPWPGGHVYRGSGREPEQPGAAR